MSAIPPPRAVNPEARNLHPLPTVRILGTHGVPAAYGGFETAAQEVGLYLQRLGWRVLVYCQVRGDGLWREDRWRGLERVLIPEDREGWLGTSSFDLKCVRHVLRNRSADDICLTFGYNTGVFNVAQRMVGIPNVINMDGMEWTRRRWGLAKQGILLANERIAGLVGDVLIADHPEIARYLGRHFGHRRVETIAYGAHPVDGASTDALDRLSLRSREYVSVICRPIPENSVEEIVTVWSARPRGIKLVVLGAFLASDEYHRRIRRAASDEVCFPGAIYDADSLSSIRFHSRAYLHGHTVGGTNPSLVEAMAAHNAVIAHDNRFNRWVAGDGGRYFSDATSLDVLLDQLLDDESQLAEMGMRSRARFNSEFTWDRIGGQYAEALVVAHRRRTGRSTSWEMNEVMV